MKKTLTILCLTAFAGLGLAQNPDCPLGGQGPGSGVQPCQQGGAPGPQAKRNGQQRGQRAGRKGCTGQRRGGAGRPTMMVPGGGPGPGTGTGTPPPVVTPLYRDFIKRLNDTLAEELYAHDYYDAAYKALGTKVFKNLSNAETNHANAVASMIIQLGGTPDFTPSHAVTVPTTVAEADAECIAIELMVIDVYKGLINDAPVRSLLGPLNNIQAANYKHLAAVGG
jgi:hypothetical protein